MQSDQKKLEVIIAKHRNEPTGTVEMGFWREFGKVGERLESVTNG